MNARASRDAAVRVNANHPAGFTKRDLNIHVLDDVLMVRSRKVIDQFAFQVPLACMTQMTQNL
jgi:hypothetical protein